MKLTTRTQNIIEYEARIGYLTTTDPTKTWPEHEGYLLRLPNFSHKRLLELKTWLSTHGGKLSPPPAHSEILRAIQLLTSHGYTITETK